MKDDTLDAFMLIDSLEALSIFYSGPQLLTKSVIRIVGRQVQAVKTDRNRREMRMTLDIRKQELSWKNLTQIFNKKFENVSIIL